MSVRIHLIGRLGNQMFQYAHARALAEKMGVPLCTNPWVGEAIFQIQSDRIAGPEVATISGYFQDQESLNYTRSQVREWFTFRPEIEERLRAYIPGDEVVAHLRRGDYGPLGYVVVSKESYLKHAKAYELESDHIVFLSEENPTVHSDFTGEWSFLPDFYRMMKARVLYRANSSFSWWAGVLGDGIVMSPVIDGKQGGTTEQHCDFVIGNWPKFAELPGVTDLRLQE